MRRRELPFAKGRLPVGDRREGREDGGAGESAGVTEVNVKAAGSDQAAAAFEAGFQVGAGLRALGGGQFAVQERGQGLSGAVRESYHLPQ
ncbi:MAG: hypothetical protein M3046_16370 [Actinomycetota bacterium]|nr:hypothetical protein [Actinomycetota bacterium]